MEIEREYNCSPPFTNVTADSAVVGDDVQLSVKHQPGGRFREDYVMFSIINHSLQPNNGYTHVKTVGLNISTPDAVSIAVELLNRYAPERLNRSE